MLVNESCTPETLGVTIIGQTDWLVLVAAVVNTITSNSIRASSHERAASNAFFVLGNPFTKTTAEVLLVLPPLLGSGAGNANREEGKKRGGKCELHIQRRIGALRSQNRCAISPSSQLAVAPIDLYETSSLFRGGSTAVLAVRSSCL